MKARERLPIWDVWYHVSTTSVGLPSELTQLEPLGRFSKNSFWK
jgi:hypothetical protein